MSMDVAGDFCICSFIIRLLFVLSIPGCVNSRQKMHKGRSSLDAKLKYHVFAVNKVIHVYGAKFNE